MQNGKSHRALKAFNLATDLEFGKTQAAPYFEMSKLLIDMEQSSNCEPLLAHGLSLLPEVKEVTDRAGTEGYMLRAFIANYDVTDVSDLRFRFHSQRFPFLFVSFVSVLSLRFIFAFCIHLTGRCCHV